MGGGSRESNSVDIERRVNLETYIDCWRCHEIYCPTKLSKLLVLSLHSSSDILGQLRGELSLFRSLE